MTRTRSRLLAAAAGAALTLGAGGLAVAVGSGAFADTSTPGPGTSYGSSTGPEQANQGQSGQSRQYGVRPGRGGHGPGGRIDGLGGGLGGPMLHGEITVGGSNGSGSTTMLVQQGKVTGVDGSTVTVESSDGFTVTWTVTDQTRTGRPGRAGDQNGQSTPKATGDTSQLAVGDEVHAAGTKASTDAGTKANPKTATATLLVERPSGDASGPRGQRGDRHGRGGQQTPGGTGGGSGTTGGGSGTTGSSTAGISLQG